MTPEQWKILKEIFEIIQNIDSPTELHHKLKEKELNSEQYQLLEKMWKRRDSTLLENTAVENEAYFLQQECEILIGKKFDNFLIESLIGNGATGVVFKAKDEKLLRDVAIKFIPHSSLTPDQLQQFKGETRTIAAINHPNIIIVYDTKEINSKWCIVTELIVGETLRDQLYQKTFNKLETILLAIQIADALLATHEKGIIHRDIKPENIMINKKGLAKLVDFGLARFINHVELDKKRGLTEIEYISTSQPVGTLKYMSPEQLRGEVLDEATDIWSLGIVVYEVIYKKLPFDWNLEENIEAQLQNSKLVFPDNPETEDLNKILTKALNLDKKERYKDIKLFLTDLISLKTKYEQEITSDLLEKFVGRNSNYYLEFWKTGSIRANYACLIFGPIWFGYRKMYLWGISLILVFFVLSQIVDYLSLGEIVERIRWGLFPSLTFIANKIYENHVKTTILEIKTKGLSKKEENMAITKKGGVSFLGAFSILVLFGLVAYFSPSNIFINLWSNNSSESKKNISSNNEDQNDLQNLYLQLADNANQMMSIETSTEFAPSYVFSSSLAEINERAIKQKEIYTKYSSLNNQTIVVWEKIKELRSKLNKTEIPSFDAGIRFLNGRRGVTLRYIKFLDEVIASKPLDINKLESIQFVLNEDIELLNAQVMKDLKAFSELTLKLQQEILQNKSSNTKQDQN